MQILQTTILYFEGTTEQELIEMINPQSVQIGIKLCKFLQEKIQ